MKKSLMRFSVVALSLAAVLANVAAFKSIGVASWFLLHQPEMPESLKK